MGAAALTAVLLMTRHSSPWAAPLTRGQVAAFYEESECAVPGWPEPGVIATPEVVVVAGTTLQILYDPTDRGYRRKKNAVIAAIVKLAGQGFVLPPQLEINLAKGEPPDEPGVAGFSCPGKRVPSLFLGKACGLLHPPSKDHDFVENQYATFVRQQIQAFSPTIPADCNTYAKRKAKEAECEAIALHELCHILHMGQNPLPFMQAVVDPASVAAGWADQCQAVSQYACREPQEFAAEVCTGLVLGFDYDQQVIAAYQALGGPASGVPLAPRP